jgi:hypothetical protein
MTWCIVSSSQTLAFQVGIPPSVLWLMLSSARTFCGCRGVFPMQIFGGRKPKRCRPQDLQAGRGNLNHFVPHIITR